MYTRIFSGFPLDPFLNAHDDPLLRETFWFPKGCLRHRQNRSASRPSKVITIFCASLDHFWLAAGKNLSKGRAPASPDTGCRSERIALSPCGGEGCGEEAA